MGGWPRGSEGIPTYHEHGTLRASANVKAQFELGQDDARLLTSHRNALNGEASEGERGTPGRADWQRGACQWGLGRGVGDLAQCPCLLILRARFHLFHEGEIWSNGALPLNSKRFECPMMQSRIASVTAFQKGTEVDILLSLEVRLKFRVPSPDVHTRHPPPTSAN